MSVVPIRPLPRLHHLPSTMSVEGAVRLELSEGVPIFRASNTVQARIEELLLKQETLQLTPEEEQELDRYEEIDEYLSFLNRVVRNLLPGPDQQDS